jgi:hypothetical protein
MSTPTPRPKMYRYDPDKMAAELRKIETENDQEIQATLFRRGIGFYRAGYRQALIDYGIKTDGMNTEG